MKQFDEEAARAGLDALAAMGADLADKLREAGFGPDLRQVQVIALCEEVGEFTGAARRHLGLARRPGNFEDMAEELADVLITAFVTADALSIDLVHEVLVKRRKLYSRPWREEAGRDQCAAKREGKPHA